MLESMKYVRKPFYVDAVQVTGANIKDITNWCRGELLTEKNDTQFVKVRVQRALNDRQTKAYIGDWVLYAGTSFKVYTDKAFRASFEQHSAGTSLIELPPVSEPKNTIVTTEEVEAPKPKPERPGVIKKVTPAPAPAVEIPETPTPAFVEPAVAE